MAYQHSLTRNEVHKRIIEVAAKSPAAKRKVGALLVEICKTHTLNGPDENQYFIVAEGYNHSLDGKPCEDEQGNTRENVIHAETACLANFRNSNVPLVGTGFVPRIGKLLMFVTHEPCDGCKAALKAEGYPYEVIGDFMKFSDGKPRMALVPASLSLAVARVLTYGAKKYKVNNWRRTPTIEPYINALERHLAAWKSGEENDPESGLPHVEHIACNAAFLIELKHLPKIQES